MDRPPQRTLIYLLSCATAMHHCSSTEDGGKKRELSKVVCRFQTSADKHMFYYAQTKYPRIFRNSYWGRHCSLEGGLVPHEIIANRNELIEHFQITSYTHKRTKSTEAQTRVLYGSLTDKRGHAIKLTGYNAHKYTGEEVDRDHTEYYKTATGIVAFFSQITSDREHDVILLNGYKQWKNLYWTGDSMRSYIKIITR